MDAILPYVSVRIPLFSLFLPCLLTCRLTFTLCAQGIYPTVIIIFVVLRKSPMFTITKRLAESLPLSRVETRIPLSILCSPREELYTGSDMTALPSPPLDSKGHHDTVDSAVQNRVW
jgi:hypothetical protein